MGSLRVAPRDSRLSLFCRQYKYGNTNLELGFRLAKLCHVQNAQQSEYYSQLPEDNIPLQNTFPSPNDPPWHSVAAVGLWILSVLLILIVPSLFLLPYLASLDVPFSDSAEMMEFAKNDPMAVFLQIVAILPAHLLTLLAAWLVVTRLKSYSFREMLGWHSGGFKWWHYLLILGSFFVVAAIVGSYFPEQDNDLLRMLRTSRSTVYIVAFVATFTAPLIEEVIYRGVLYSAFQRAIGVPAAFLLVTFLFAVVHVPQYYPSFSTIALLTLLSLTLTAIRVRSQNLLPCIILHTLFNGVQSVFLLLEPLIKQPDLQTQSAVLFHLFK